MARYSVDLSARCGEQAVKRLASAYEAVLLSCSIGRSDRSLSRETRGAIIDAMLTEGEASQFCTDRMRAAGAAVVALSTV